MNKILILDDDPERHKGLTREYPGTEIFSAWTAKEGIKMLEENPDLILLDHDLQLSIPGAKHVPEGGIWIPDGESYDEFFDSGQAVVREMVKRDERPTVRIHSWNPHGARLMYSLLKYFRFDVEYIPFGWQGNLEMAKNMRQAAGLPADWRRK